MESRESPGVWGTHKVKIADITVKEGRQRQEMGDLEGLASSILRVGLLQPVILTRTNELIAGERRIRAHQMNGAVTIDALYRDELDPADLEELELEENIRRKQLTWQEEQRAIARLHQLRVKKDPKWSQLQTAEMVAAGEEVGAIPEQRDVSVALTLDKMMVLFPEIAKAKNTSQAINMARALAKTANKIADVQARPVLYQEVQEKIFLGDSVKVIREFEDGCVDLILTDPPFGINYDDRVSGTIGDASSYEDDAQKYEYLLTMAPDLYRILRKDGWLVWFFGVTWYEKVKHAFRDAGFTVDEIPIIWDRSEGRTYTNRPDRYFTKAYDMALHCFKGEPGVVQRNRPNVLHHKPVENKDRELLVERPISLYAELIERLTVPGQVVADFFVGSGSVLAAAASLKRDYIGVEQDEGRRASAIQKVRANIAT